MTATQVLPALGVQYPRPSPVQAVARALGCTDATAKQLLNPADDRNPWVRAAKATEALVNAGHVLRSEGLCRWIDAARQPRPLFVSQEDWEAARERAQVLDGREDVAEIFIKDAASYLTWRRLQLQYIDAALSAVRIGDGFFGVAA